MSMNLDEGDRTRTTGTGEGTKASVGTRQDAVRRISNEVALAHSLGQVRTCKITTLRHAFRGDRTTSPELRDVTAQLASNGVQVQPVGRATRNGCVVLSLAEGRPVTDNAAPVVSASVWHTDRITDDVALESLPPDPDGVVWFNIDVPSAGTVCTDETIQQLFDRLVGWCPGLEIQMIRDLITEDVRPKVEPYGDDEDGIRSVSLAAVIARESPDEDDLDGVREELLFELVESVVADSWLITMWHPTRIHMGAAKPAQEAPLLRDPILSYVRHQWLDGNSARTTAGDLGLALARAVANTYGASHRMIERWVESWELDFFKHLGTSDADRVTHATVEISNILTMVGEFRRRLTAFQDARGSTSDQTWFPGVTPSRDEDRPTGPEELATYMESVARRFELLFNSIRADMDLLMLRSLGTQQEASERLQDQLSKVTALLLVPTLIAGIFGANTQLPGGGKWIGFELMVALMVVSALVLYLSMRKYFRDRSKAG